MDNSSQRYAHIDSLRAIAALLVVWMHTSEVFVRLPETFDRWPLEWAFTVNFGRIGVALFFIISGFVIPSSLRDVGGRLAALRAFAIKRFFRLYPLFWLSVPLGLVTSWWIWDRSMSPADVLANLTMLPSRFGAPYIEGLYWTLEIELAFYLFCAGLFLFGLLRNSFAVAGVAIVLSGAFLLYYAQDILRLAPPTFGHDNSLWLGHLGLMFTGTLLRRWHDGDLPPVLAIVTAFLTAAWGLVLPTAALVWNAISANSHPELLRYGCGYGFAMTLFIAGAFILPLRSRALAWCGLVSYSLYLLHPVVFYGLLWILEQRFFGVEPRAPLLVYIALSVALTLAVSGLTYHLLETPMNRLGARLAGTRSAANRSWAEGSGTRPESI